MKLITDIIVDNQNLSSCVATIGFFDGLHKGHKFLIDQVKRTAAEENKISAVITFPIYPRKVLHPDFNPELLSTLEERMGHLQDTGIDECFLIPFTFELSQLSAYDFMYKVLKRQCNVSTLVIGYDHRFGHNRSEGFNDYVRFGEKLGIEVLQAKALQLSDFVVSSSVCRSFLLSGEVGKAAECLGYFYSLSGYVISGYKVGRTIGFPTANLHITDKDKLIPARGVYAVKVILRGVFYKGMLNIGSRPTINNGDELSIEVNILGFSGDIYQEFLRIEFVSLLREEIKFPSVKCLVEQLHRDRAIVERIITL